MNHYKVIIKFENTTFYKDINRQANCKSDAITSALNLLSNRDFDKVESVEVIEDKGNKYYN